MTALKKDNEALKKDIKELTREKKKLKKDHDKVDANNLALGRDAMDSKYNTNKSLLITHIMMNIKRHLH